MAGLGDDEYLELLDHVHAAGLVTDLERRQVRLVHLHLRRVHREHPQPGDPGYMVWLETAFDAGQVDVTEATELLYRHDQIVRDRRARRTR